ncbi:hypothetical protein Poly59_57510 [Rubripirellula reticaptiva]|uniref:Uncharacterized protein n=1 Tax=Rubripirellula reticaptiva TaxID=2528013 RepID=A0A5C6ECY7_9BACT|nr:hypothetical protein Poly59_57510 [Rubripirellula reticaptiva]
MVSERDKMLAGDLYDPIIQSWWKPSDDGKAALPYGQHN